MSWPVAGTLMIEPTRAIKKELDRFCNAMIEIREEARRIGSVNTTARQSIVNAPHTADDVMRDWDRPYDRERAIYPTADQREDRYWPPVNRIDQVYGDRQLVCSCRT